MRIVSGLLVAVVLTVSCRREQPRSEPDRPSSKLPHPPDLAPSERAAVDAQPPPQTTRVRPANVPKAAAWVGGPDGGAYVWLAPAPRDKHGVVRGKIFHENGDPWFEGAFRLEQPSSRGDLTRLGAFEGWDGERLYLSDGRSLKALSEPTRPSGNRKIRRSP